MARIAALTLAAAMVAGCGAGVSNDDARATLDDLKATMVAETGAVVDSLEEAGLEVGDVAGESDYCQSEPAPGVTFSTGGTVAVADPAAQFETARGAIEDQGWEVDTEGADGARPWANFTKDDLRLSLSQAKHGPPAIGFSVAGECIRVEGGNFLDGDRDRVEIQ